MSTFPTLVSRHVIAISSAFDRQITMQQPVIVNDWLLGPIVCPMEFNSQLYKQTYQYNMGVFSQTYSITS